MFFFFSFPVSRGSVRTLKTVAQQTGVDHVTCENESKRSAIKHKGKLAGGAREASAQVSGDDLEFECNTPRIVELPSTEGDHSKPSSLRSTVDSLISQIPEHPKPHLPKSVVLRKGKSFPQKH